MGWDITITTDKPVTSQQIDELIPTLPPGLRAGFGKQPWGWSLAFDLRLDNLRLDASRQIWLSGSCGMSGKIAEGAAEAVARRLEKLGFKVEISEMSV